MRFLKYILLFVAFSCEAQNILTLGVPVLGDIEVIVPVDTGSAVFTSFDEFMDYEPARRFSGWNPVITHAGTYTNICPGGAIIDPNDPTKYLFYVGEHEGNTRINAKVTLYEGVTASPILGGMTSQGTVLQKSAVNGDPDDEGAAFGSVVQVGDTVYHYYCGIAGAGLGVQSVCLATSLDGRTFTKRGRKIQPDGVNEFNLTDPTVYYEGGNWYMYVTGKGSGSGLPISIVCYTSSNGHTWTRSGVVIALGGARDYDARYIEGCGFLKAGTDYILMYTTSSNGNVWSCGIATSTSPTGPFTKEPIPWFQHSLEGADNNSIAVPLLFNPSGDNWYIFYQGTEQFQPADVWDVCASKFVLNPETFPVGQIVGHGSWTGDAGLSETTGNLIIGTEDRTIRMLNNATPNLTTSILEHPTDVTPAANSSYNVLMRSPTVSSANFIGGYYVYEGSTVITGLYFNGSQLKHLTNLGWVNVQGVANNTTYSTQIVLTSNSTYNVIVNGVTQVTGATPSNNIVTKANKIRFEKNAASPTLVYFGDVSYTNAGVTTDLDYGQQ